LPAVVDIHILIALLAALYITKGKGQRSSMAARTPLGGIPASNNIPRTLSKSTHDSELRVKKYKLEAADERRKRTEAEGALEAAHKDKGG
jgi:hypothetical protein